MTATGGQALVRSLEKLGVDTVFGIPGATIMAAYQALVKSPSIRHILVSHEQGAGHAATGYAQATGRVGVCMTTSGPGATNLVTPIADAYMDSVPLVAITGQVPSTALGNDAFQAVDISGITMSITKHSITVTKASDIPQALKSAFRIASNGRPGPVLVDITMDATIEQSVFRWPEDDTVEFNGHRTSRNAHPQSIKDSLALLEAAQRPVLYVGGGVLKSNATSELLIIAEATGIPVTTTLMALGSFPESHPQYLGMPGMCGSVPAVAALQKSDLIIALGARFDDRVIGVTDSFAPEAKIIHVDIDPAEVGKNRTVDVPIIGDVRDILRLLSDAVKESNKRGHTFAYHDWWGELDSFRRDYPVGYRPAPDGELSPQRVIERIGELVGPDAVYTAGVGQHQMWAAQFLKFNQPRTWLNSGGLGTMGYAIPAALGAGIGQPGRQIWAIDGDGCFKMTSQELATCAANQIPIKVAIINNGSLGMVGQLDNRFYDERKGQPGSLSSKRLPDFVKLAEALGCHAFRCQTPDQLDTTIKTAMSIDDAPVVIDFIVHKYPQSWPMVGPDVSVEKIAAIRALRPDFGYTAEEE